MNAIVAVDRAWGIGKNGRLLTHLPEDMKFFRTTTKGKVVVMGRKTLESFPDAKPLKNRINIVLTRDENFGGDGLIVCRSADEVFSRIKDYDSNDVYIIGGESVYKQFLPYCGTAYVTHMDRDFSADTKFVNLNETEGWEKTESGEEKEYEGLKFAFCTYKNRKCREWHANKQ